MGNRGKRPQVSRLLQVGSKARTLITDKGREAQMGVESECGVPGCQWVACWLLLEAASVTVAAARVYYSLPALTPVAK